MNCLIYLRVSTQEQVKKTGDGESYSIPLFANSRCLFRNTFPAELLRYFSKADAVCLSLKAAYQTSSFEANLAVDGTRPAS